MADYFLDNPVSGVVVGDDGSDNARQAVEFAIGEAQRRDVPVHVIRVFSIARAEWPTGLPMGVVPSVAELAAECRRRLAERWGDGVVVHAVHGPAAPVLLAAAEDADVLVVGAKGSGRIEGLLLGSVAQQVLRDAPGIVIRVAPSAR